MASSGTRWATTALAVACVIGAAAGGAWAAKPRIDARVFDLRKKIHGRSGAEWAAEWWQWVASIPEGIHPLLDASGEFVEIGQRGPVWFLGGTFGSGAVVRTARIPTGRALFFPVLNSYWDNVGFPEPFTVRELLDRAAQDVSTYDRESLRVTVDGNEIRDVDRMRVTSRAFAVALPPGSMFESISGGVYTAGVYSPAVTDGYWVMLKPLAKGRHTVRIQGSSPTVAIDVTYQLDVIDHDQPFPE